MSCRRNRNLVSPLFNGCILNSADNGNTGILPIAGDECDNFCFAGQPTVCPSGATLTVVNRGHLPPCPGSCQFTTVFSTDVPVSTVWNVANGEVIIFETTVTVNTNVNIRTFINTIISGLTNRGTTIATAHNVFTLYINDVQVAQTVTSLSTPTNNLSQGSINFNSNGTGTRTLHVVVTAQLIQDTPSATSISAAINTLLGASKSFLRIVEI